MVWKEMRKYGYAVFYKMSWNLGGQGDGKEGRFGVVGAHGKTCNKKCLVMGVLLDS